MGRPMPMDTPNEFAYLDFKKYAYKQRGMIKREMLKRSGDSSKMFVTLSALWYKWAHKNAKAYTHIKDKLKFGRALMVMMVKDDLIFSKKAWKGDNKITTIKEGKDKYQKMIFVYTEQGGLFYGTDVYVNKSQRQRTDKLRTDDTNKCLKSYGIDVEIPRRYNSGQRDLDKIVKLLKKQGIEADHHDFMDVS